MITRKDIAAAITAAVLLETIALLLTHYFA